MMRDERGMVDRRSGLVVVKGISDESENSSQATRAAIDKKTRWTGREEEVAGTIGRLRSNSG
jgi:hypothetical protein